MTLIENIQNKIDLDTPHIGVYAVLKDGSNTGFIGEYSTDLKSSLNKISTEKEIATIEIILSLEYLPDPLKWNKTDGVLFRWGDKYTAAILPSQLPNYTKLQKEEILDRLCSHFAGVPSNYWRFSEGLLFAVKTISVVV